MKVCFVIDSLGAGGAERVISALSNNFINRDIEVNIIHFSNTTPFYYLDKKVEIYNKKPTSSLFKIFQKINFIKKIIKQTKPNVIISFLPNICCYSYIANKNKIPFIVSERNDPNTLSTLYKKACKFVFNRASGCVFQTKDAQLWYGNKVAKKSIIILNPVFLTTDKIRDNPNNKIISVGRLNDQKDFVTLIKAFKIFNEFYDGFALKIIGEGKNRDSLQQLINESGLKSKIELPGNITNWHESEINSALFVSSSVYEGMPNALLEALSLGIPCVATNCPIGGSKILMKDYQEFLCNIGDEKDMASKMVSAIKNKLEIKPEFKDEYDLNKVGDQWINFINKIIEKRRASKR